MASKILRMVNLVANVINFMVEPLVIDACDAENRDSWDLPHAYIEFLFLSLGYNFKLFCVVMPVGYCEVMFLCMYGFCLCRLS